MAVVLGRKGGGAAGGGSLPDPSGEPDGDVLTVSGGTAVWSPGGGSIELIGAATPVEIIAGAIDVTGLHYILLTGEGGQDDTLESITGGVDGQMLLLETDGAIILIPTSTADPASGDDPTDTILGDEIFQVMLFFSAEADAWYLWSPRPSAIGNSDGQNGWVALDDLIQAEFGGGPAATIDVNGWFQISPFIVRNNVAIADAALSAGDMGIWLDPTNGAAKMMIKAKQLDGTVVTGELALA